MPVPGGDREGGTRYIVKFGPFREIVHQIRWLFRFWRGSPWAVWKLGPPGGPIISDFLFCQIGHFSKNSGSNPVTFPFWEGLPWAPWKAWSPLPPKSFLQPWFWRGFIFGALKIGPIGGPKKYFSEDIVYFVKLVPFLKNSFDIDPHFDISIDLYISL